MDCIVGLFIRGDLRGRTPPIAILANHLQGRLFLKLEYTAIPYRVEQGTSRDIPVMKTGSQ